MVKYVPLSPAKHAGRRWCRPFHFGFASQATVVAITGAEIANAATNMPIAFVKEANRFQLVGVLSYQKGRNLFVGPDGRWIGTYTPAVFRTHPFRFLRLPDAETLVLCVDEESHLIEEGRGTEPFFDDAGHRSRSLDAVVAVLEALEKSRAMTAVAVRALDEAGVIAPWKIEIGGDQREALVGGLYRVDESLLQKLDDASYLKLRKAGALPLAFAQLISMARLGLLVQLSDSQKRWAEVAPNPTTLSDFLGGPQNELLKF